MERRDQGISVRDLADTHDDYHQAPGLGTLRRIAGDVWKALRVMEPGCEANAVSPDPMTIEVTVRLDALFVGPFRRRRLQRLAYAVANAATARNMNITIRVVRRRD